MSFFDAIKESFQAHSQKRKEEQELIDRITLEGEVERKRILEEEMRKNVLEVVRAKA